MMWTLILLSLPILALSALVLWDVSDLKQNYSNWIKVDLMTMFTGVLMVFTGAASIIAFLQWKALLTTDDTYWSGQRPWLGIKSESAIGGKLFLTQPYFDDDRDPTIEDSYRLLVIDLNIPINNYGNIPSIESSITFTSLVESKNEDDKNPIQNADKVNRFIIESRKITCESNIESLGRRDVILTHTSGEIRMNSVLGPSIFPKESSRKELSYNTILRYAKHSYVFSVYVAGCIRYRFGEGGVRNGSTFFVYRFANKDGFSLNINKGGEISDVSVTLLDSQTSAD